MVKFIKYGCLVLFMLAALIPFGSAIADTGPKPTMEFTFQQEFAGSPLTIISGTLFECDQPDCQDAKPLEEMGPQGFICDQTTCSAMAYGFSIYHRLEIQFSDGVTRQSNIFMTAQFNSSYSVTIRPADLLVKARLGSFTPYILMALFGGICLVGVAVAVIVVILLVRRSKKR